MLKTKGVLGFICSNKWTRVKYGLNLRKKILEYSIRNYIDFTGKKIFKDATVDTSTIIIKKVDLTNNEILIDNEYFFSQKYLNINPWTINKPEILDLKNKLLSKGTLIKDLNYIRLYYGIKTGYNNAFIIDENIKNDLISKDILNNKIIKPVLRGKDIERYIINYKELYLITSENGLDIVNDYPYIYEYLNQFKDKLIKRSDQGDHYTNLRNCVYYDEFLKPKIIWQRVCKKPNFVLDINNHFMTIDSMVFLTLEDVDKLNLFYLIGILNSNLIYWYLHQIGHQIGKGFLLSNQYVEQLPIKIPLDGEIHLFDELVENIQNNYKKLLKEINGFLKWLQGEYHMDKLSQKLEKYYELSFDEFLEEVRKKKVDTKKRAVRENLEDEFNNSLSIIKPLQSEIQELEDDINQKVYKLYDLTDDEIKIIEDSLNE